MEVGKPLVRSRLGDLTLKSSLLGSLDITSEHQVLAYSNPIVSTALNVIELQYIYIKSAAVCGVHDCRFSVEYMATLVECE